LGDAQLESEASEKQITMSEYIFVFIQAYGFIMDAKRSYADYPHHSLLFKVGPSFQDNLLMSYCLN